MSDIKRTGPPTPRAVKGRIFTWTLPINAVPHAQWKTFFTQTKDRTLGFGPDGVRFYLATMIFESDEAGVPTWIQFIDRWTASANERFVKWDEEQQKHRQAESEESRDAAQRLREAAEKFKNL